MTDPRELQPGLWHWPALHPDWTAGELWPQQVSSYAVDQPDRLLLLDPLAPPETILDLASERQTAIVLSAPWHERDTQSLVNQLGVPVFTPPPDTEDDLMRKFRVTREQAAGGSPDIAWLMAGDVGDPYFYGPGDRLPIGIEAFEGREHNDLVLWLERQRAVIAGDTLVDFGDGLRINEWLRDGVTREQVADRLRPLLDLPVELVLPAHGQPTTRSALERALA